MTDTIPEPKCTLDDDQHARIAALEAARMALQSNSVFGPGTLPPNRGAGDLTYLAEWILEGYESHDLHADSGLEAARQAGYSEAITDAIGVVENHVSLMDPDVAEAIRKLAEGAPVTADKLRESDLEWGRKQGRKEALIQTIEVATALGAIDVAAAIRQLEPNADESPTEDEDV